MMNMMCMAKVEEAAGCSEAEARDLLTALINCKIRNIEIIY